MARVRLTCSRCGATFARTPEECRDPELLDLCDRCIESDGLFLLDGLPATLTCDHAASSYGRPVLVWQGEAFGPGDLLWMEAGVKVASEAVKAAGQEWRAVR